MTQRHG